MVAETKEIAVGALGGALIPAATQVYKAGKMGPNWLPDALRSIPNQAGIATAVAGGLLGIMGARGKGPLAGNSSAIAMSTALGATAGGVTLFNVAYPLSKRTLAAGVTAPTGGETATQGEIEIEVGETAEEGRFEIEEEPSVKGPEEAELFEEEETEAATPSGEVLGGI